MMELQVIKAEPNKHFTVEELVKIFTRPGIVDYRIVTSGFTTSRIKVVELVIDKDLLMLGPTTKDSTRTEINGFSKE